MNPRPLHIPCVTGVYRLDRMLLGTPETYLLEEGMGFVLTDSYSVCQ